MQVRLRYENITLASQKLFKIDSFHCSTDHFCALQGSVSLYHVRTNMRVESHII